MKLFCLTKSRKPLALAVLLLLLLSLAGCWSKDDPGSTEGQDPIPSQSTAASVESLPPETTTAPATEQTEATTAPTEAIAEFQPMKGRITAGELNIRKSPGSNQESVGSYFRDQQVEILEILGKWGRTDKGWISLNYVEFIADAPQSTQPPVNTEVETDGNSTSLGNGVVTLGALNVRTGPGTKYEDIGDVKLGQRYAYYQKSGNWVRISEGWISANYFYIEGTTGENSGTGVTTGSELNVRTGPGTSYKSIDALDKDEKVTIYAQVNGWGYTGKGWISMKYVTMDGAASGTSVSGIGEVTGSNLNIRKEPGTDAEIVGSYDKDEKVEILETKGNWGRTDKGWISLTYVKMTASTGKATVTGSSLNIRKEPGTDAEIVGSYDKDEKVEILEIKGNWGRTDKGWISLTYVDMDD